MFSHPLPSQAQLAAKVTNSCVAATTGSETSVKRARSIKLIFLTEIRELFCSLSFSLNLSERL